MSKASEGVRNAVQHSLDALAMISFNDGFEAALNAIDELSDQAHNNGQTVAAETLRNLAKDLRGDNA
jgi:hypothetical protein